MPNLSFPFLHPGEPLIHTETEGRLVAENAHLILWADWFHGFGCVEMLRTLFGELMPPLPSSRESNVEPGEVIR